MLFRIHVGNRERLSPLDNSLRTHLLSDPWPSLRAYNPSGKIFSTPNSSPYVKDGINEYVVNGNHNLVNPDKTGTKSAAHYQLNVGAGKTAAIRLRLSELGPAAMGDPFNSFAGIIETRQREADEFYKSWVLKNSVQVEGF